MTRRVLLLAVVAVLASACELRIGTDVAVTSEGAGAFELVVALDDELVTLLEQSGFDGFRDLDAVRAAAPRWEVDDTSGADGVEVRFRREFAEPEELSRIAQDLQAALAPEDGRLYDDLGLSVDGDQARFSGRVGLVPPTVAPAEGPGITFDEEDLADLLEERGDEFVRYELRVTLPGEVVEHDGDGLEGSSVTWTVPVGSMRDVVAVSDASDAPPWLVVGAVALVVAAATAAVVVGVRARRARVTPAG